MTRSDDSTKSVITFAVVVGNSTRYGTASREDPGLGERIINGHRPMPFSETEFPGDIILDKICIIANSEASSGIGIVAETEVRLNKNAIRRTMVTEDTVLKSNCSITVVGTWGDVLEKFFDTFISLRSEIKHQTIPSDQSVSCHRRIKITQGSPYCSS